MQDRASSSLCYICSPSIPPPPSNNVDWSHYLNRFTKHVPLCQSKPLDSRGQKRKKKCLMMTPPTNNEDQQRMKRPLSLSHEAAPTGEERKRKKEKKKKKRKKKPIGGAANVQPTPTASPQPTLRIPFFLNDSGSRVMHSYFHVFSFPCISIHARVRLCKPSSTTHVTMHRIIHVLVRELLLLHCSVLRVKHEVI